MTLILYDGEKIVADTRVHYKGLITGTVQKMHIINNACVTASGSEHLCEHFIAWYRKDAEERERCAFPYAHGKENLTGMVVHADGALDLYTGGPYPARYMNRPFAIGSGRELALGAMMAGANIMQAYKIACAADRNVGGEPQVVTLKELQLHVNATTLGYYNKRMRDAVLSSAGEVQFLVPWLETRAGVPDNRGDRVMPYIPYMYQPIKTMSDDQRFFGGESK